jgi:hypothetical protein
VALYLPAAAALFRFAPPQAAELAAGALAGVAGVLWYEVRKVVRRR